MLRGAIFVYGLLAVAGAAILARFGVGPPVVLYLLFNGTVVLLALLFERGRYGSRSTDDGPWQETGERFVDPSTGQVTVVRYNPRTGARKYIAVPPDQPPQT